MHNNRRNERQHQRIPLRFGIESPSKVAFTDNITPEGLFIRTSMTLTPGTRIWVEMTPPAGPILLVAEVRWAKKIPPQMLHKLKGGMGLKIIAFQSGQEIYQKICDALYNRHV